MAQRELDDFTASWTVTGFSLYERGDDGVWRPTGDYPFAQGSAPLLPHQCERVAQRSALGIARTGGAGENSSGDLALAFSTGNRDAERGPVDFVANEEIDPLFYATIEATEEAIVNALLNAETMTGRGGTVHALHHDRLTALIASSER